MTKRADGTLQIDLRDIVKHPAGVILIALATAGGGTGAMSAFGLASKSDMQKVESRLASIEAKVDELSIEAGVSKRLRDMQASAQHPDR